MHKWRKAPSSMSSSRPKNISQQHCSRSEASLLNLTTGVCRIRAEGDQNKTAALRHAQELRVCGETDLVSEVLDNERAVGHARLLKEGTCLQVGVVQLLSPGVVRTFRHLAKTWEKSQQLLKKQKRVGPSVSKRPESRKGVTISRRVGFCKSVALPL